MKRSLSDEYQQFLEYLNATGQWRFVHETIESRLLAAIIYRDSLEQEGGEEGRRTYDAALTNNTPMDDVRNGSDSPGQQTDADNLFLTRVVLLLKLDVKFRLDDAIRVVLDEYTNRIHRVPDPIYTSETLQVLREQVYVEMRNMASISAERVKRDASSDGDNDQNSPSLYSRAVDMLRWLVPSSSTSEEAAARGIVTREELLNRLSSANATHFFINDTIGDVLHPMRPRTKRQASEGNVIGYPGWSIL